uniref:Potassium channel domain-containing protein n=1 Tax=Parascaris equorum TaxID=6256 RepID=A0A914S8R6_PAREQ
VVGYALLGAVVFRAVEGPHETSVQSQVTTARQKAVNIAWNATFRVNKLDRAQWERTVHAQVKRFQHKCLWAIKRGYDGKEFGVSAQWTFTGAFLYSLTVITTIGYGNTSAKTYFGKTLTILFAIIDLLTARAQLDQLEVKESVEAQLQRISVPLSLVFFTMFAYLVAGSIIFCVWEGWTFLDSFYFCYISLTTIGLLVFEGFVQFFLLIRKH